MDSTDVENQGVRTVSEASVYLTVKDVAARIGVHPETIRRWERRGIIDLAMRRRGRRVYRETDLRKIEESVFTTGQREETREAVK
jgi:excisionase family DNA binding protein